MLGVVAGAALGPAVLNSLNLTDGVRPVAAVLVLVICGSLGSTFGYWIGEPMRNAVLKRGFARPPEMLAGSLFSVFAVLSVAWFLGLTFSGGPSPDLGLMIQRSVVLRSLDTVFPRPPGFLSGVRGTLANVPFPSVFAGLPPLQPEPLQPPASVDTQGVRGATEAVYRVESRGCGGIVTGSAYPVAPGYLVTNAHVVSGTFNTQLSQDVTHLRGIRATVVLFDPDRDVAILWAPQVSTAALTPGSGIRGTPGAVIGYPGGGPETTSPAIIEEPISATGRDIFNDRLVTRQIYIMATQVRPGNSGGPVVDLQGHVLGLVFAASSTNPEQGYALTSDEIQSDVTAGVGRTGAIDTTVDRCAV